MSAIRKIIQRQLFQKDDEIIQAIVNVSKLDGKKKKNQTLLCLAVTIEHPIAVRLYFVKGEKDDTFKKKDRFNLREVEEVDGIIPIKPSPEFHITIGDRQFTIVAGSTEEKDEFLLELYNIFCQHIPEKMPNFLNFSIELEAIITPTEIPDHYQLVSSKEDADFRKLIERANLTIDDTHISAELLIEQSQPLDTNKQHDANEHTVWIDSDEEFDPEDAILHRNFFLPYEVTRSRSQRLPAVATAPTAASTSAATAPLAPTTSAAAKAVQ